MVVVTTLWSYFLDHRETVRRLTGNPLELGEEENERPTLTVAMRIPSTANIT